MKIKINCPSCNHDNILSLDTVLADGDNSFTTYMYCEEEECKEHLTLDIDIEIGIEIETSEEEYEDEEDD